MTTAERDPVDIIERAYLALEVEQQRAIKARLRQHRLPKPRPYAVKVPDEVLVPNALLREAAQRAVARGDWTWGDLALAMGYKSHRRGRSGCADSAPLKRALGIAKSRPGRKPNGKRYVRYNERCMLRTAVKLADLLDLAPVELGF